MSQCGSVTVPLYFYRWQTNFDVKKCKKRTSLVQSQLAFFHSPEHEVHNAAFSTSVCPSVVNMYFFLPFRIFRTVYEALACNSVTTSCVCSKHFGNEPFCAEELE